MLLQTITLLLLIVSGCSTSDVNQEVDCRKVDSFVKCEAGYVLIFVNQTAPAEKLRLETWRLSGIAPNAFQDLSISELIIILASDVFEPRPFNIQPESFTGLPNLTSFHIEDGIFSLDPSPFTLLSKLKHFSLYECDLTEIPRDMLADFSELEELWIMSNNISTITIDSLSKVNENLVELDLMANKITIIEARAFSRFKNLKRLSLDENQLINLSSETFKGLPNLNNLSLKLNRLSVIKRGIFNHLQALSELNLQQNVISEIEADAFSGMNLQVLNLEMNRLTTLQPGTFNNLAVLRNLDLSSNKLTVLPNNVFRSLFKSLKNLNFDANQISRIEQGSLEGLVLNELLLSRNKLTVLEENSFDGLNVGTLDLSRNNNLEIKSGAFNNLTVEKIVLSYCGIEAAGKSEWGLGDSVEVIL
uniref:LRRCT domain-containing protein n=1 Tax=Bracon brevicornis TaxID=1563983 RepID=A0A6V7HND0_9HYME